MRRETLLFSAVPPAPPTESTPMLAPCNGPAPPSYQMLADGCPSPSMTKSSRGTADAEAGASKSPATPEAAQTHAYC